MKNPMVVNVNGVHDGHNPLLPKLGQKPGKNFLFKTVSNLRKSQFRL
jgi:hypothetical protein